jgi:hypothetical protein
MRDARRGTVGVAMNQKMVVHCQRAHYDVLIDRTTPWGNPYTTISDRKTLARYVVKTHAEAIEKYESWVRSQPLLVAQLYKLYDKVLGCWCDDPGCHGWVLVKLINELCVDCRTELRDPNGNGCQSPRCQPCYFDAVNPDNEDG